MAAITLFDRINADVSRVKSTFTKHDARLRDIVNATQYARYGHFTAVFGEDPYTASLHMTVTACRFAVMRPTVNSASNLSRRVIEHIWSLDDCKKYVTRK